MKAIKNISNLVQITDSNLQYKTNQAMNNVCELEDVAMIFDEKIVWIGKNS